MWWPLVHWWTPKRIRRPSSSGTFSLGRRREASTARALHTGLFSSQFTFSSCKTFLKWSFQLTNYRFGLNLDGVMTENSLPGWARTHWASMKLLLVDEKKPTHCCLCVDVTLHTCFCFFQSMGLLDKKSLKINGIKWESWIFILRMGFSMVTACGQVTGVSIYLQGLLLVSRWQHHSFLGTWRQRHPSKSDSDADALPSRDPGPQPLQRCGLQTALAEEWRLSLCQSGQDP